MGNRMYTSTDCTVFSYKGDTGLLAKLGDGTISAKAVRKENSALLDSWTDVEPGPKNFTITAEFACEDDDTTVWFDEIGATETLVVTTDTYSVTATFAVLEASQKLGDAMRWNVSLESKKDVVVS